jgi:MFS family permease
MTNVRTPFTTTRLRWVLGLTSTAYFMVVLDSLVVITALPKMQRDLHADLESLQGTVNSYGIAFATGIITAAALGDRFGRRRVFNLGLALFTISSAACALAHNEQKVREPMVPMRLFGNSAFAVGNLTTFLMSGATFAAAFLITQEFQFARGYSPIATGVRLLPFFATPMVVSPLAGALSDRIGRRPIMLTGLALQAVGYTWVAARGSLATSWVEIVVALLVAGIGISMALPTVPTAVLSAVAEHEMGKASGVNYMAQRFGAVFSIAIASAVFAAHGHLGNPAAVTAGFRPALWSCVIFAVLAAVTAIAITARPSGAPADTPAADVLVAA